MAAKKKAKVKSKVKRKSTPAKKLVTRKKTAARKKPAKKAAVRRAAPKSAAIKRPAPKKKPAPPVVPAARAASKPKPKPQPVSLPAHPGVRIGVVTHYFSHLSVAVVRLEAQILRVGDTIHFKGHTTDFTQRVESLQVNHQPVMEAGADDDFGLKVINHAREGDVVYKV